MPKKKIRTIAAAVMAAMIICILTGCREKLSAEQPADPVAEKGQEDEALSVSTPNEVAEEFLKYLSEGDAEKLMDILYFSKNSIVTADHISAGIEKTELARFVGGTYTLDNCVSDPGEDSAYFSASCGSGTSLFRMKKTGEGWKVDLEPDYYLYVNDMEAGFPDSPSLMIDGKKISDIKEAPDNVSNIGLVAYTLTFPCHGVEVTAGFEGFKEKRLRLVIMGEKSGLYVYEVDDVYDKRMLAEKAAEILNTLFDSANEERYECIHEDMAEDEAESLRENIDAIFDKTKTEKVSFRIQNYVPDCIITAQDTYIVEIETELLITEGEKDTPIASMDLMMCIKKDGGEYKLLKIDQADAIDAIKKWSSPKE